MLAVSMLSFRAMGDEGVYFGVERVDLSEALFDELFAGDGAAAQGFTGFGEGERGCWRAGGGGDGGAGESEREGSACHGFGEGWIPFNVAYCGGVVLRTVYV
jgi:hypothetical protein